MLAGCLALGLMSGDAAAAAPGEAVADVPQQLRVPLELTPPEAEAMALDQPVRLTATGETPAMRSLTVDAPGLLTLIATPAEGNESDVQLLVADQWGQGLLDGSIDMDPPSLPGGEMGSVALDRPGRYLILVETWDDRATVELQARFIPLDQLVHQPNPQGDPEQAGHLTVGRPVSASLMSTPGDHHDWFVFVPARTGTVSFETGVPGDSDLDLYLELYEPNQFWEPTDSVDDDRNEQMGSERIEVQVQQDQPVYLRVNTYDFWMDEESPYTLRARWEN